MCYKISFLILYLWFLLRMPTLTYPRASVERDLQSSAPIGIVPWSLLFLLSLLTLISSPLPTSLSLSHRILYVPLLCHLEHNNVSNIFPTSSNGLASTSSIHQNTYEINLIGCITTIHKKIYIDVIIKCEVAIWVCHYNVYHTKTIL